VADLRCYTNGKNHNAQEGDANTDQYGFLNIQF
jgi:hypothetical protein